MANDVVAEYGLAWPPEGSFTGRIWITENPALAAQWAKGTRSGISPRPQLRLPVRMENRGMSTPALRDMVPQHRCATAKRQAVRTIAATIATATLAGCTPLVPPPLIARHRGPGRDDPGTIAVT